METIPKKSSQSDKNIVAAVIQMVSGSDLSENLRCAEELIFEAVNKGATLILLPEVFAVLESGENGLEKMVSCAQATIKQSLEYIEQRAPNCNPLTNK